MCVLPHSADSAFEQLLLVLLDSGKVIVNLPSLTCFAIATWFSMYENHLLI